MSVLLRQVEGRIATLTLNRPERKNALSRELVVELGGAMEELAADDGVRCIVLTGAGGSFCAGADLREAMGDPKALESVAEAITKYHKIVRAMVSAPKPIIAQVDGPAVGFGCDLALAADMRILSDRAYLQEKFVRIGLMPDGGGSLWLTRMVGIGRALELLLTGDSIPAARAVELGLANYAVPVDELQTHTTELASRLAKGPPLAQAAIKRAVRGALSATIDQALETEREGQLKLLHSADFMEGVAAWMQKREPDFKGH